MQRSWRVSIPIVYLHLIGISDWWMSLVGKVRVCSIAVAEEVCDGEDAPSVVGPDPEASVRETGADGMGMTTDLR